MNRLHPYHGGFNETNAVCSYGFRRVSLIVLAIAS
jgi:hypothetical protein